MKQYKVLVDSKLESAAKAGTVVYEFTGYDYGLARDDTRFSGIRHISVTLNENGERPCFTIPFYDLEEFN